MKLQWALKSPKTTTERLHHGRDPPLSLCLIFDSLVLADGFTVFHGHFSLVGTHLFALPALWNKQLHIRQVVCIQFLAIKSQSSCPKWSCLITRSNPSLCVWASCAGLSPFMNEFELQGLLLLDSGQELLEVFTLLGDMAVLHLLLLTAVTTD